MRKHGVIQVMTFVGSVVLKVQLDSLPVFGRHAIDKVFKLDAYGNEIQQNRAENIVSFWYAMGGLYVVLSSSKLMTTFDNSPECVPQLANGYCSFSTDRSRVPSVCLSFTDGCSIVGCEYFRRPPACNAVPQMDPATGLVTSWVASWNTSDPAQCGPNASVVQTGSLTGHVLLDGRAFCLDEGSFELGTTVNPAAASASCAMPYYRSQLLAPLVLLLFGWILVRPSGYVVMRLTGLKSRPTRPLLYIYHQPLHPHQWQVEDHFVSQGKGRVYTSLKGVGYTWVKLDKKRKGGKPRVNVTFAINNREPFVLYGKHVKMRYRMSRAGCAIAFSRL
jgi:hypothetical protein